MALRTWIVAIVLLSITAVVVFICTPMYFIILGEMNATAQQQVSGDAQTALNSVVALMGKTWGIALGIFVFGILVWAYISPQRKEYESYQDEL